MSVNESTPLNNSVVKEERSQISCRHFLFLPVFTCYYLSFALHFYVANQWIQDYLKKEASVNSDSGSSSGCTSNNVSDPDYATYQSVEQKTALWQLLYSLSTSVPAFFATTILPSYSDALGRRFLFLITSSSTLLKFTVLSLIIYYKWPLYWMLVVSVVDGMTGSVFTFYSAGYAYLADITSSGRARTLSFSAMDGLVNTYITLSGFLAGYYIELKGFFIPMATTVAMSLAAWILVLAFLPETHLRKNRSNAISLSANFSRIIEFYKSSQFLSKRLLYIILLIAFLFEELANTNRASVEMLYQLGKPFCWPSHKIGIFSAARHGTQGLAGMVLIVPLKKCFSEVSIAIISNVCNGASFALEAFAQTDLVLYLVTVIATLGYLSGSMIKSIMSSMTPVDKQGSLFASVSGVSSLCGIFVSFICNAIYAATVSYFHGFIFLVLAAFCVMPVIFLLIFSYIQAPKDEKAKYETVIPTNTSVS